MFENSKLIYSSTEQGDAVFKREFDAKADTVGRLVVSALGVFEIYLNGRRVGCDVLAPGWQYYEKRIGAYAYDNLRLRAHNVLEIRVARGWFSGRIDIGYKPESTYHTPAAAIAELTYTDPDGNGATLVTDDSFSASRTRTVWSDIYDGIVYDARRKRRWHPVAVLDFPKERFVLIDSVRVKEHETVDPVRLIVTPKGERVLDFGINLVGYPVLRIKAHDGERVSLSFAEILDKDGNFYNENYRMAKCRYEYTCREGVQAFKPFGTFYGYRYVRLDEYPHDYRDGELTSLWIHSDIKRTGYIRTANEKVNRLFENIIRGQRGNFVDIPTDCPQRDERLGWTGDAQVFVKTAVYNYDCLSFFKKWLVDLMLSANDLGEICMIAPVPKRYANWRDGGPRAAWSDAITIIPWELYRTYGDKSVLLMCLDAMRDHIDSITRRTIREYMWCGDEQFGDWLGLDAESGSLKGKSRDELIATAFYARSTELYVKSCHALGIACEEYEELYNNIKETFIHSFENNFATQTECAVALHFDLVSNRGAVAARLVELIAEAGYSLRTGFVGTPYVLHVLSENGYTDVAYRLLLREEYPSWLYPVSMGATTIWEHWDGLRPDGSLWSATMNSYNHYAYGSVADWIYSVAAGITPDEPGYTRVRIAPTPSKELGELSVRYASPRGEIVSNWKYEGGRVKYFIATPVPATIVINGRSAEYPAGEYTFEEECNG